jgi:hypothetical protein
LNLFFTNPAAVTAIRPTSSLTNLRLRVAPPPIPRPPQLERRINGRFFNTGTPVNDVGDVAFVIQISQYSNENLIRVLANVFQCSVSPCSQGTPLGHRDLGVISLSSTARLLMQWDQPNHQFIFQRDNGPRAFVQYTVSDTAPPFGQFKTLDIFNDVANLHGGSSASGLC